MELIGIGGFSPLTGFMGQDDYENVVKNTRLVDGTIWSIPITLPATEEQAKNFNVGEQIALKGKDGIIYGTITLREKYAYDKKKEMQNIYGTADTAHPA
ncbi:PUA-like domain-containing protein [Lentibacillus halodurans]|uniref:PUA-like domain-containing protein n=1 Tax=Lentibacillus halodurans TaxID=237679 RepID=A0A1I0XZT0_9BACI|nr:PUA-like domain-containing protein [Lentibacillus halodurans]